MFVTTAVSSRCQRDVSQGPVRRRRRVAGSLRAQWQLIAIDRATGDDRWTQTAYRGVPREKRHIKSTYANQTPATDGETVVAFFGSQGLYAYDMKGALRWKQDLGVLNAGAYDLPEYRVGQRQLADHRRRAA